MLWIIIVTTLRVHVACVGRVKDRNIKQYKVLVDIKCILDTVREKHRGEQSRIVYDGVTGEFITSPDISAGAWMARLFRSTFLFLSLIHGINYHVGISPFLLHKNVSERLALASGGGSSTPSIEDCWNYSRRCFSYVPSYPRASFRPRVTLHIAYSRSAHFFSKAERDRFRDW